MNVWKFVVLFKERKLIRLKYYWIKENVTGDFLHTCIHNICYFLYYSGVRIEKNQGTEKIASSKCITNMAAVYTKYMKLCSLQSIINMKSIWKILGFSGKRYYAALFNDCVYIFFV